jgi:2,3-bisphosphoglycerate-dependent phosphoglycerate mutase
VQLLLVRHGETQRAEAEVGPADPGLTEQGHAQARRLAVWIARHEPVDHIVSSPLLRARQTAAPLCDRLGLEPEIVADLAEFDAGSSTYIPMEEMKAARHPRLRAMVEGRWDEFGSDVDPDAFRLTIVGTLDRLALSHPGERVAVICHGAVINTYLGDVIGTPRLLWFEPRYTSLNRVLVSRDGIRSVETLNELPHLQADA